MKYYRFPYGSFEREDDKQWLLLKYKPMPCTPAGDPVGTFRDKINADRAVIRLNRINTDFSAEQAYYYLIAENFPIKPATEELSVIADKFIYSYLNSWEYTPDTCDKVVENLKEYLKDRLISYINRGKVTVGLHWDIKWKD